MGQNVGQSERKTINGCTHYDYYYLTVELSICIIRQMKLSEVRLVAFVKNTVYTAIFAPCGEWGWISISGRLVV